MTHDPMDTPQPGDEFSVVGTTRGTTVRELIHNAVDQMLDVLGLPDVELARITLFLHLPTLSVNVTPDSETLGDLDDFLAKCRLSVVTNAQVSQEVREQMQGVRWPRF